ncbi:MAG: glycosyltransferase family 4 protein [Actinomycetota bacterium]
MDRNDTVVNLSTRATFITNFLPPYRVDLFRELVSHPELDVRILALAQSEETRDWKAGRDVDLPLSTLRGRHLYSRRFEFPLHLSRDVSMTLGAQRPDVIVIGGWDQPAYWAAARFARRFRVPLVLWNGSTNASRVRNGRIFDAARRWLVRQSSAYVAYGSLARDYLTDLGAEVERVHVSTNTVNVREIGERVARVRAAPGFVEERRRFPNLLAVFVGRLVSLKRLDIVIDALARVGSPEVGLLVVGDGRLRAELEARAHHLGVTVRFEGFKEPEDVDRYRALADIAVIPSDREAWGLVVNEALAAGLYALASDRVGSGRDLLDSEQRGAVVAPNDLQAWADVLEKTRRNRNAIVSARDSRSVWALQELSIARAADGIVEAVDDARRRGSRR